MSDSATITVLIPAGLYARAVAIAPDGAGVEEVILDPLEMMISDYEASEEDDAEEEGGDIGSAISDESLADLLAFALPLTRYGSMTPAAIIAEWRRAPPCDGGDGTPETGRTT